MRRKIGKILDTYGVSITLKRDVDTTHRETDEEVTEIANAKWTFTLEELLPPGTSEPGEPSEPFAMSVVRALGNELFTGCKFTEQSREDTIRGVTQIRKGTAEKRMAVGIL